MAAEIFLSRAPDVFGFGSYRRRWADGHPRTPLSTAKARRSQRQVPIRVRSCCWSPHVGCADHTGRLVLGGPARRRLIRTARRKTGPSSFPTARSTASGSTTKGWGDLHRRARPREGHLHPRRQGRHHESYFDAERQVLEGVTSETGEASTVRRTALPALVNGGNARLAPSMPRPRATRPSRNPLRPGSDGAPYDVPAGREMSPGREQEDSS